MSYSMSPPAQKPAPRPYSPYGQNAAGSPTNAAPYGPPPAKRQRMSPVSPPNAAAPGWAPPPHGLPNLSGYGNPYGPNSAVQSPYASAPTYGQSPSPSSFNTPQPYPYHQSPSPWQSQPPTPAHRQISPPSQQSREMMPPPPRPQREDREEKVGVEEIGDSLFGSGINLKDEENYMHAMYTNRHHTQDASFSSANPNTSFGSSTMSPGNSFNNLLTQGTSFGGGSQEAAAFAGTMGQTQSQEDVEVEQRKKREAAAREQAARRQHHLNNQFLQCNNVRKRMDGIARKSHVSVNMQGVFIRQPDPPEPQPQTSVMVNGAGTEGVVATREGVMKQQESSRPESVVNQNTAFEQMVSLVSLAAGERIRGLLDEAYSLSRARRYGDYGRVVPAEFAEIAEGEGKRREDEAVVPESISGTEWDKVLGQNDDLAAGAEKPKSSSTTPQPQSTISFSGTLNAHLRHLAEKDRQAERDRIAKREARKRKAAETTDSATPPADAADPDSSTAATGEQPKLTKKEQLRQQKEKNSSTEAQLHNSTNQTAAMMALGKKGSRYSWMTGGVAGMPTNRFAKATTSGTTTPTTARAGESGSAAVTPGGVGMVRGGSGQGIGGGGEGKKSVEAQWGDWREEGRKGVEMRDWVLVLERDGREKGALVKAVNKLE